MQCLRIQSSVIFHSGCVALSQTDPIHNTAALLDLQLLIKVMAMHNFVLCVNCTLPFLDCKGLWSVMPWLSAVWITAIHFHSTWESIWKLHLVQNAVVHLIVEALRVVHVIAHCTL